MAMAGKPALQQPDALAILASAAFLQQPSPAKTLEIPQLHTHNASTAVINRRIEFFSLENLGPGGMGETINRAYLAGLYTDQTPFKFPWVRLRDIVLSF